MIKRAKSWGEFDFEAYEQGHYSPPPELVNLPDAEFILTGWGGQPEPRPDDEDDDGCPKSDPDCLGNNGDCHDACESVS